MQLNQLTYEVKDSVAYIGFGKYETKSMTTLTADSLMELRDIISEVKQAAKEKQITGLILHTHKPGCFLAGADISLIASLKSESEGAAGAEKGQMLFNEIEDLPIPSVACIDGICLGGGLEISMACTTLIASDRPQTKLGLPEVMLGILPGFGGTYRLPKRVGLPTALDMILSGKQIPAKKAKKIGLVAEVYAPERMLDMAVKHLNKSKSKAGLKDSLEDFAQDNFITRKIIFQKARESVLKKTKGFYQAPLKILDVMEAGSGKSRSGHLALESSGFGELCVGDQSKNLQHIFFMQDEIKKQKSNSDFKAKVGGVLGAGTMGGGIAWLFAQNGQAPIMKDLTLDALELGLKQSSSNFQGALKRKRLSKDDFERKQRSIKTTTSYDGFNRIDLVVEAIVEDMGIKKKVLSECEGYLKEDAILTSNTSSLSVGEMSSALKRPEKFAGLHFFNPVHKMPLVEIITHDKVDQKTVDALVSWSLQVKKTPIVVKDGPGFLVNRILAPWMNEAAYLLEEGVSPKDLDDAALNFGMPMGPCRLLDEVGLDVMEKVGKIMHDGLGERLKPAAIGKKIVETGDLGRKTGKGFYEYDEKGKVIGNNSKVFSLLPSQKKKMEEKEIQMRLFLPMINESAYILADGITDSPATIDVGMIFGLGFPPFRGGLLRYADYEGVDNILRAIEDYADKVDGDRYKPCPLLVEMVNDKKKFYDMG